MIIFPRAPLFSLLNLRVEADRILFHTLLHPSAVKKGPLSHLEFTKLVVASQWSVQLTLPIGFELTSTAYCTTRPPTPCFSPPATLPASRPRSHKDYLPENFKSPSRSLGDCQTLTTGSEKKNIPTPYQRTWPFDPSRHQDFVHSETFDQPGGCLPRLVLAARGNIEAEKRSGTNLTSEK